MSKPHLDPPPPSPYRFAILALLCLAASFAYLCRNSIGVAESTIREQLNLTKDVMSWVMSLFFLTYAIGQIPTGWLGGKIGSRLGIAWFAALWSVSTAVMGLAMGWPILFASRTINGAAQAGLFPACTASIGKWFPANGRAVASGMLASSMSVGAAIGTAITGFLVIQFGWRTTFASYGGAGLLFAVFFYLLFRNEPAGSPSASPFDTDDLGKPQSPETEAQTPWLAILLSPPTWWICGQQCCRAAGQMFFASWFATYLQETREVTVQMSGLMNSLPLIGIVVGAFLGGAISDFLLVQTGSKRIARSGVASTSMFLCSVFVFLAYGISDPWLAVITISAGTFCASVGGPCAYTVTIDMGGKHVSILFGAMNMVGNLGAFAFIHAVPSIVDMTGWTAVLALFGILYLGAMGFWLLLNPKGDILEQSLVRPLP